MDSAVPVNSDKAQGVAPVVGPESLTFKFALNKQLLSTISIDNRGEGRLAFKIKTTAPKKYVVRPSSGVIEARASQQVQVIMQAQKEYPTDFVNCKDKFMVQTTALAEDEQPDKDTFSRDLRKDLREARLRVVIEAPNGPPSPVPEANEGDADVPAPLPALRSAPAAAAAAAAAPTVSAREADALKSQLANLARERDELRRKLDFVELQGGGGANKSAPGQQDPVLKFRVTLIHIILVAILAFLIGHYT